MKIAICLSGQPRAWKRAKQSFTELLDNIKINHPECVIDIFIHTWNFNTKSNINIDHTDPRHPTEIYRANSTAISKDELDELIAFYQPKKYLVEDIDKSMKIVYDAMFGENPAPAGWSSSQFYSMQRVAFLKRDYELEIGEEYDWCIRYRFDLDMNHSPFNIPTFSNFNKWVDTPSISDIYLARKYVKPSNTIYTIHSNWDNNFWPYYRIGDICFVADSLTYDLVCSFYDWLLWIPTELFFHGATPEVVLCYYVNMLKINLTQIHIDPGVLRDY